MNQRIQQERLTKKPISETVKYEMETNVHGRIQKRRSLIYQCVSIENAEM